MALTNNTIPWTRFMDMHSGGWAKEKQQWIYIQAPESEAAIIFQNRFGHNPYRVTCACCGDDYNTSENLDLAQLTAYDRGCQWSKETRSYVEKEEVPRFRPHITLEQYMAQDDVLFIRDEEIQSEHRQGKLKRQGYIWVDDDE